MSSESVCQVARSWMDVGNFNMRLVVRFMIFTASVRNIRDTPSYSRVYKGKGHPITSHQGPRGGVRV
jgi:hypothetical protein